MDILKGYSGTTSFVVPAGLTNATYETKVDGVVVGTTGNAAISGSVAEATLPYKAVSKEGQVTVELSFIWQSENYTLVNTEYVYTPILPLHEIGDIIDSGDEAEQRAIEMSVRHIIQAHCGQTFGNFVGKRKITGGGDAYLRLPQRLMSFTTINGSEYWQNSIALRGGGWYLVFKNYGVPTIRADFDGWHEDPYANSSVPIMPPRVRQHFLFTMHREYEIDGSWGWISVPSQVEEAARLLVNDYACGDSNYRDRFLTSMTAADWRIQFHDGAFSNTGNVRANQLLAEYVLRRGWTVI